MTPKDNERLARFSGWKLETHREGNKRRYRYISPRGQVFCFGESKSEAASVLPVYANSLHYIHTELEPALEKAGLASDYAHSITNNLMRSSPTHLVSDYLILHASAEHRAQAALIVIKRLEKRSKRV